MESNQEMPSSNTRQYEDSSSTDDDYEDSAVESGTSDNPAKHSVNVSNVRNFP